MSQGQIVLKLLIDAGTNVYVVAKCSVQGEFEYTDEAGTVLSSVDVDEMKQLLRAELHIERQSWVWEQDIQTRKAEVTRTTRKTVDLQEANDGSGI